MKHIQSILKYYIPEDGSFINADIILNTLLSNSQDTIYFKDKQSRIILSSKAHSSLYGTENPREVIGKSDFDFFPLYYAQTAYAVEQQIMKTQEPVIGLLERLERHDGSIMWLSASKYPLFDENGEVIGTWGTSRDITELIETEESLRQVNKQLKEANRQLMALSSKDSLTGLFNHGHFLSEIRAMFGSWKNINPTTSNCLEPIDTPIDHCLILFDIDDFKLINDTFGHSVGDAVIRHIGQLIVDSTRINASSYRCGGDEFAMIITNTTLVEAKQIAENLRSYIESNPFIDQDHTIPLTVSLGVSSFSEVSTADRLIQTADDRLYVSKEKGKNQVT